MATNSPIVLFHYAGSPFAARVLYYLALRGIPYDECNQPRILPRPDLTRLGISYRRIPLLAIGRDVYLDTPLILKALERVESGRPSFASAATPEQRAVEQLLAKFTLETKLFFNVVQILLPNTPLIKDEAFMKDRVDMMGIDGPGSKFADIIMASRPDSIVAVKNELEFLETTLLADGRQWLAKTETPGLADIEMVWPLAWLFQVPGGLAGAEEHISARLFPKVFAWVERFQGAIKEAQQAMRAPETFSGEQVAELLKTAAANESVDFVEESDPFVQAHGLRKGQMVQLWPTDTGARHKTVGKLLGLTSKEITIETTEGDISVRVHAPRRGFSVAALARESKS